MIVLNQPVSNLKFADIQAFCKEGHLEGLQLDYKLAIPKNGLAKHFASFSNSRGGVLIIGVEEDSSGKPKTFKGIVNDKKIVDQIHQFASDVDPRPEYQVAATDEVGGRVFILVRIFEGARTPYYKQNDPSLYMRTGNITDPIGLASPEEQGRLFAKTKEAELARSISLERAAEIRRAAVAKAERERQAEVLAEMQAGNERTVSQQTIGDHVFPCTVTLQPTFPTKTLLTPAELHGRLLDLRTSVAGLELPTDDSFFPIPDGVQYSSWGRHNGSFNLQQLHSNGLVQFSLNVRNQLEDGRLTIPVFMIASRLFCALGVVRKLYEYTGYQGGIQGEVALSNCEGIHVTPMSYRGDFMRDLRGPYLALLPRFNWKLEMDTSTLSNAKESQAYFIDKVLEIHWGLGIRDTDAGVIEEWLKSNSRFVE